MVFPPRKSSFTGRKQSSMRDEDVFGAGASTLPRARRRFGQNFLTDGNAIRRIGAALAPLPSDNVLEIEVELAGKATDNADAPSIDLTGLTLDNGLRIVVTPNALTTQPGTGFATMYSAGYTNVFEITKAKTDTAMTGLGGIQLSAAIVNATRLTNARPSRKSSWNGTPRCSASASTSK